jgi:hypothetical protein
MTNDISIDDPTRYDRIIFQNFMKELCRRDDEANRNPSVGDGNANIFSVEEIRQQLLNAFPLESVLLVLRGHILENRDDEPLELLDNETNVRLTDAGRTHCGEYGV